MELSDITQQDFERQRASLERVVRRWVSDGQEVEDIVQETWLYALEQPQGRVRHLDRWLRGVARLRAMRFHRSHANLRAREAACARAERDGSKRPDELVDEDDALLALHTLIDELEEPYRTVLQLRYVEDHDVAEIAALCHMPEATVRTQLRRGRIRLKERWDRTRVPSRFNGWVAALLARLRGTTLLTRAAVTATCVAAVVVPLQLFLGAEDRVAAAAAPEEVARLEPTGEPGAAGPARVALPALPATAPPAQLAALTVECVRADTGQAAADLGLELAPADPTTVDVAAWTGATDRAGRVLADLAPGLWRVRPAAGDEELVQLRAGEPALVRIEVPARRELVVETVRRGQPLAGASVWLSFPGTPYEGRFVGETDTDGRLVLSDPDPAAWVGARSHDDISTPLRLVRHAARLRLHLPASPARFTGRVVDETGAPVAGAEVSVQSLSEGIRHTEQGVQTASLPVSVHTEHDGTFELPWWGPSMQLAARAPGFRPLVTVRSTRMRRHAVLTLERARAAAPPAEVHGVALDASGRPLADWVVRLDPTDGFDTLARVIRFRPNGRRYVRTGADGSFAFDRPPDGTLQLALLDPADATRDSPRVYASAALGPDRPEEGVALVALDPRSAGSLHGRVAHDHDCNLELYLDSDRLADPVEVPLADGRRFLAEGLLPGRYDVIARRPNRPVQTLTRVELAAGERLDLGDVPVPEQGSLVIRVESPDGEIPERLNLLASNEGWVLSYALPTRLDGVHYADGVVRVEDVPAGRWRLRFYAHGFASAGIVLDVEDGGDASGSVALVRGANRSVLLRPDRAFSANDALEIDVWSDGRPAHFVVPVPGEFAAGNWRWTETLPEGPLFVQVATRSGLRGEVYVAAGETDVTLPLGR